MHLFQDWQSNKQNIKGKIILFLFRLAHLATKNKAVFIVMIPYLIFYRIMVEWILGCELPYKTVVGKGLKLFHGQSLVINDHTVIGNNCTLRHCTTIGNKQLSDNTYSSSPVIGDNVDIGSNVCIIGNIRIGNNVKIGVGAVVVKDVPDNAVVVGNPAAVVRIVPPQP